MNLVSMSGVSKSVDSGTLFKDVSVGIDEGDRIGLIGPNGCGKSTFMRIVAGEIAPDSGTLARARDLSVSVLPQNPTVRPGMTLRAFLLDGDIPAARLSRAYEDCLHAVSAGKKADRELAELTHRMECEGGFAFEQAYDSLCLELGLPGPDAVMDVMSGGMRKKAALARLLASGSRLLLLDEPTNHLDVETIEWLEGKLASGRHAFLLVTHDRRFLDAACTHVMEIDREGLYKYEGGFSRYLERRRERWLALERADARREAILKIETAWLMRGARARATKSERRKEGVRELREAALERPERMEALSQATRRLGKKILVADGVCKSYGGRTLLRDFTHEFSRGDRLGLVGPNGAGKTTLMEIIEGAREPDSGTVERGVNTSFGYLDQRLTALSRPISALEYVREAADEIRLGDGETVDAERFLERFMFDRRAMTRLLPTFSGGELKRLALARLLASAPNFLLLDEPTNDLDIETIELLENYLEGFEGCALVVSHDRAFLDTTTEFTIALDGAGGWRVFPDSYGGCREEARAFADAGGNVGTEDACAAPVAPEASPRGSAEAPPKRKATWKETREYESLLAEIDGLEAEKAGLEASFSRADADPAMMAADGARYRELGNLIDAKLARWEELAEIVGG